MEKFKRIVAIIAITLFSFTIVGCEREELLNSIRKENYESYQKEFEDFEEELISTIEERSSTVVDELLYKPRNYTNSSSAEKLIVKAIENKAKGYGDEIEKLRSFDSEKLTEEQQLTYRILDKYLSVEDEGKNFAYYESLLNVDTGIHNKLILSLNNYNICNKLDIRNYFSILKSIPDYFKEVIEIEEKRLDLNFCISEENLEKINEEIDEIIGNSYESSLITEFNSKINEVESLTQQEKDDFIKENKEIVEDSVLPGYRNLKEDLLEIDKERRERNIEATLDKKQEYFNYILQSHVGTDKTPEEVRDKVYESYIENDEKVLDALYNPNYTSEDYSNINYGMKEAEEILEYLKEKIKDDYPKLPEDIECEIIHFCDNVTTSYYITPYLENYKENYIYINDYDEDEGTLFTTMAHEGYPGHLYQTTYFYSTNPSEIRTYIDYLGYTEGWATYAENNAYDMIENEDKYLLETGRVLNEWELAVMSLVDIGVNYYGWGLQDVEDFFYEGDILYSPEDCYNIVSREAGYYLNYFFGYLEIEELREYAEEQLGDKFNLKDFHQALLEVGSVHFSIVKEEIDKYIESI